MFLKPNDVGDLLVFQVEGQMFLKLSQTRNLYQEQHICPCFSPFWIHSASRRLPLPPRKHMFSFWLLLAYYWSQKNKMRRSKLSGQTHKQNPFTYEKEGFCGLEFRTAQLLNFFFQLQIHSFFFSLSLEFLSFLFLHIFLFSFKIL